MHKVGKQEDPKNWCRQCLPRGLGARSPQGLLHCFLEDAGRELPLVSLLATGGTIAGAGRGGDTVGYSSASIPVDELIEGVPGIERLARLRARQFSQTAGEDVDLEHMASLAEAVRREAADEEVAGVVITHGTDTIEETACFLDLAVDGDKPIVLVGAMRPATALSADGPLNLLNAVAVAASPSSRGMGAMVVMNDSIYSARDVRKTHTTRPDALRGGEGGLLGTVVSGRVAFHQTGRKGSGGFARLDLSGLPRVDIIYCYAGTPVDMIDHSVSAGARGIVLACVGDGSIGRALLPRVRELARGGLPIVRSTRVGDGPVIRCGEVDDDDCRTIPSGILSPQRSRILLALAIKNGLDRDGITRAFEAY